MAAAAGLSPMLVAAASTCTASGVWILPRASAAIGRDGRARFAGQQASEHRHAGRIAAACQRRDHADLEIALHRGEGLPQGRGRLRRGDPLEGKPGHMRVILFRQQSGQRRHRGGRADHRELTANILCDGLGGAGTEQTGEPFFEVGSCCWIRMHGDDGGIDRLEGGCIATPIEGFQGFKRLVEAGGIIGHCSGSRGGGVGTLEK
jgi:hypothetical protein